MKISFPCVATDPWLQSFLGFAHTQNEGTKSDIFMYFQSDSVIFLDVKMQN